MITKINSCSNAFNYSSSKALSAVSSPINLNKAKLNYDLNALAFNNRSLINFKGLNKDSLSFENFDTARIEAGINSIEDLEKNIKKENKLGEGLNSRVYSFDDPKLSNWAIKVDKDEFDNDSKKLFKPVEDEFKGQNFGQEIALAGTKYRILKKIDGEVHSIDNWSNCVNNDSKVDLKDAQKFQHQLNKLAKLPQKTFDDYAKKLEYLEDHGWKQDSINPNNILIDYNKEEIYIIDSFKATNSNHTNSRLDLINVLLDFTLFNNFYNELDEKGKEDLLNSARQIITKCNAGVEKTNLSKKDSTYINYITEVDKWFGCALIHKGGDYRTRFNNLKNLLDENSIKL